MYLVGGGCITYKWGEKSDILWGEKSDIFVWATGQHNRPTLVLLFTQHQPHHQEPHQPHRLYQRQDQSQHQTPYEQA